MKIQKPYSCTGKPAVTLHAFLTGLIWLCVLPIAVLAGYLAVSHVRILQDQRDQTAANLARNVMTAVDRHIGVHIAALQMMAASPLMDDPPRMDEFYQAAQGFHKNFSGHVILADLSMQMIFNTRLPLGAPLPKLPVPKGHAAAPLALATGKPAVGDMFLGPIALEPLVAVVVPILRDGRTRFLLVNSIETRQFQQRIDEVALPDGWFLTLRDGKDEIMAQRFSPSSGDRPADGDSHRDFIVSSSVSSWSVVLEISRNVHRAPVNEAAVILAAAILSVTLVCVLGGRLAGRRLSRSVAALAGNVSFPVSHPVIAEIEAVRRLLEDSAEKRETAETIRRESDAKYRLLAENATDVIWILDLETMRFRYVSPSVEHLRGYTVEEVMSQDISMAISPHSLRYLQAILPERIERFRQGHIEFHKDEIDQPHKNGEIVRTEVTSRYVMNQTAGHVEVIGVTRDITERKQAEQALKDGEQRLRYALHAAKAGTWEWDLRTNENFWSEELWKLYGLEADNCSPSYDAWKQSVHPDDRQKAENAVQDAVRHEAALNAEWRVNSDDGTQRWLMSRGQPVFGDDGMALRYIGIVMDITERKKAEKALYNSLEEKVSLLKEVHHRVKNNLQIVASLLSLQANRTTNREVVDILEDTRNRVKSMALLHEALYHSENLARINFTTYVNGLCGQLILSFGPAASRVRMDIQVRRISLPLESAVPCGLIVNELVSNALKHGFPAGRTGTIGVKLEKSGEQQLVLSVRDDGVGLAPGLDPAGMSSLGLQLVSILANQLGGRLEVEPSCGAGAAFRVMFPVPENTLIEGVS